MACFQEKSLGDFIDKNFNWNNQIDNISQKASKGIGILRRAKMYISQISSDNVPIASPTIFSLLLI